MLTDDEIDVLAAGLLKTCRDASITVPADIRSAIGTAELVNATISGYPPCRAGYWTLCERCHAVARIADPEDPEPCVCGEWPMIVQVSIPV